MPFTRRGRPAVADRNVRLTDEQILALSAYLDRSTADYRGLQWWKQSTDFQQLQAGAARIGRAASAIMREQAGRRRGY